MEWLAFWRAAAVLAAFYVALPTLARGRATLSSPDGWVCAFVRFSLFLELSILFLGVARLALPGAVAMLCVLWLGLEVFERKAPLLLGSDARRRTLASFLASCRNRTKVEYGVAPRSWREHGKALLLPCLLVGAMLAAKAWFPVHNLRLEDASGYSRAVSLAVLSSGHDWRPDLSVPLLLPLHNLASLTAPRTVAFSEPLFAAMLPIAVAIAAFSLSGKRLAAIAAMATAAFVSLVRTNTMPGAVEIGAVYLILALALWRRRRSDAVIAALLGVAVAPPTGLVHTLVPYMASVGLGVGAAQFPWRRYACARLVTAMGLAGIVMLGPGVAAKPQPDGPLQYEEAATLVHRLAKELPRNSWMLVSRGEALPYIYGRGWHLDIAQFMADANAAEAREPSYRLPLPVRDVYFLLETTPLDRSPGRSPRSAGIDRAGASAGPPNPAALAQASYEYQLAEWLTAYRRGHDDLVTVYEGEKVTALMAPGKLRDYRGATR
jgi:hypothetical protein